MAAGHTTFEKRRKERDRQAKKREKLKQRELRRDEKAQRPSRSELDFDPDIAGIVPGPQPLPDEML